MVHPVEVWFRWLIGSFFGGLLLFLVACVAGWQWAPAGLVLVPLFGMTFGAIHTELMFRRIVKAGGPVHR